MKLLLISNLYPPGVVGGYEVLCHQVASGLASRGHEITVLTSSYGVPETPAPAPSPGQTVDRALTLPVSSGNIYQPLDCTAIEREQIGARNNAAVAQAIERIGPDVVFVWNLFFLDRSVLDTIRRVAPGIVYLLTDVWLISFLNEPFVQRFYHETLYGGTAAGWRQRWRDRWRRWRPQRVRGRAILPSHFMQQLHSDAGIRFDHSIVIHHGTSLPEPGTHVPRDRTALCESGRLLLLFAGRIVHVKGVHLVLEALPQVLARLPGLDVHLTVLGDDRDQPYVQSLRTRVQELGLEARVQFAPAVPERDLPQVFDRHDIYLFPSLHEPFSLTLIHALASGIPTVASNAGGNPDIIIDRVTGMLYPKDRADSLAEAVTVLATDHALRKALSENGSARARQHTIERMIGEVESYLAEVA